MSAPPERPPYSSYAAIVATFTTGLLSAGAAARLLNRDPRDQSPLDLIALAGATFSASRTLSRDKVTSFIREPFVEGKAYSGEGEKPAGEGLQRAIGELVTCSRCLGVWTGAGLAASQLLAPRLGRLLTWSLTAAAANDFLQAGFVVLTEKANVLQQRAG